MAQNVEQNKASRPSLVLIIHHATCSQTEPYFWTNHVRQWSFQAAKKRQSLIYDLKKSLYDNSAALSILFIFHTMLSQKSIWRYLKMVSYL